MSYREIYAVCIYACMMLLAGAFGGISGIILMNMGLWIGAIDLGWIDDWYEEKPKGEEVVLSEESEEETPLPDNVIRLPVRKFG